MNDYLIIYERAEDGGWGAHSPDVEGVSHWERRARRPSSERLATRRVRHRPRIG